LTQSLQEVKERLKELLKSCSEEKQIRQSEGQVLERDQIIAGLRRELDKLSQSSTEETFLHKTQLQQAQDQVKQLEAEISKMSAEIEHYESRLGRGDFDPQKTKVSNIGAAHDPQPILSSIGPTRTDEGGE